MKVTSRPFMKEVDCGLIVSTWPKNAYYSHSSRHPIAEKDRDDWFADMYWRVNQAFHRGGILIACSEEDPVFIFGFSAFDGDCLEFIWVRPRYRKQGIARFLLTRHPVTHFDPYSLTKAGEKLIATYGLKELSHENRNSR